MNHGLLNKLYYKKLPKTANIFETTPDLYSLYIYFNEVNIKDQYYVAMKYHAIKLAKRIYPEITLKQLAELVNLKNHASVLHYMNNYIPLHGHRKFIDEHFNFFITNKIYPISINTKSNTNYHGLFKQVTLDEIKSKYHESIRKKKKIKTLQNPRIRRIQKDEKEKYD